MGQQGMSRHVKSARGGLTRGVVVPVTRVGMALAIGAGLLVATAISLASVSPAGADTTVTFTAAAGCQTYTVPTDINQIDVTLVGGAGFPGEGPGSPGGRGGEVTARLNVQSGAVLYGIVAPPVHMQEGGGSRAHGGAGGDADYATGGFDSVSYGGGGGGATFLSTDGANCGNTGADVNGNDVLAVAGGGGGGGSEDAESDDGGTGGDAGQPGGGAESCLFFGDDCSAGGSGGGAGTSTGGGGGGTIADSTSGGWLGNAPSGSGTSWTYQDGATDNVGGDFGGAGGGGWFGGGQGGDASDSYGGGGGGSNYVQSGVASAGTTPSLGVDTTSLSPEIVITPAPTRRLTVAIGSGTGTGSVTSSDSSINCGSTCTGYYNTGSTVTLTANTPSGMRFVGWTQGSALTSPYALSGSTTLYASWSPNVTDDVNFNSEGGSTVGSLIGFDGASLPLPDIPTQANQYFDGWYTAPTGGTLVTSPYTLTGSGTLTYLYAKWSATPVDIVDFNSDGGSNVPEAIGPQGSTVALPSAPTYPGHSFAGWFAAPTGGTALTSPYTFSATTSLYGTTELYAQWTSNTTVNVLFNTEGGSAVSSVSGLNGTTVTLPAAPTLSGSNFAGWFTAPSGGTALTSPYILTGPTELYAQWTTNTIDTVTFNSEGGSLAPAESGIDGGSVILPPPPSYPGFTFTGWFAAPSGCTTTATTCTVTMNHAQTVTATFNQLRQLTLTPENQSPAGSGTITANPPGYPCGTGCIDFDTGTSVTLSETPGSSSDFLGWGGSPTCDNEATTCTIYMADRGLTYYSDFIQNVLTVVQQGSGSGTITGSVGGVPCASTCSGIRYPYGTSVMLSATPAPGSSVQWAAYPCDTLTVDPGPCTVTMDGSYTIYVTFSKNPELLTVNFSGGLGNVVSSPAGISCSSDGGCGGTSHFYDQLSTVTLTATGETGNPYSNSTFTGWTGDCTSTNGPTCTVTMNEAETVTANFTPIPQYALTVTSPLGSGAGTITSADGGINCGVTCIDSYYYAGTEVTLTESPGANSVFTGWSGYCSGTSVTCTVDMTQAQAVSATFILEPETLTVTLAGTGTGTVSGDFERVGPSPENVVISCGMGGTECTGTYQYGDPVNLFEVPADNAIFTGWSGDCTGTSDECQVTMNQAHSVTANFMRNVRTLTVATSGAGGGTVTSDLSGTDGNQVNCGTGGSDCTENYDYNTTVTLTATPRSADSYFIGWTGACTNTSGPCFAYMINPLSATAVFGLNTLTVSKAGGGSGTITSGDATINCGTTCTSNYPTGTSVVLTATPSANSTFTGWSSPCQFVGEGTCTISVTGAKSVTATFTTTPSIQVDLVGTGAAIGSVYDSTGAITCGPTGTTCYSAFLPNTSVELTASTPGGSSTTFDGWSGACSGTSPTCIFTPADAVTVTATFTLHTNTLTVTTAGTGGGMVTSTPAGISCAGSSVCTTNVPIDNEVGLTAVPDANSTFTGWSGFCTNTSNICNVTDMSVARAVTATFTAKPTFTLTVGTSGTGTATITTDSGGIDCPGTCSANYQSGTLVWITAIAGPETTLSGFGNSGCIAFNTVTGGAECEVQMSRASTVDAFISLSTSFLGVSFSGTGTGTVTSSAGGIPSNINCLSTNNNCGESFETTSTVTLTATATGGSSFGGWDGFSCENASSEPANVCLVGMNGFTEIAAVFTHAPVPVTLRADGGPGTGEIDIAGGGSCSFECTLDEPYLAGAELFLTATPDANMQFVRWQTCNGSQGSNECILGVNTSPLSAIAVFAPVTQVLTLGISTVANGGTGTGTVTISSSAGLVTCTSSCTTNVDQGDTVTLTASATPTSTFNSWAGSPCGTNNVCTVTVAPNAGVFETARFQGVPESLYVSPAGTGSGTITSGIGGINCGTNCSTALDYGTIVQMGATPVNGSVFTGWSGACTNTTGSCSVDLQQTQFVTANFTELYTVSFDPNGGSGTMSPESDDAPTTLTTGAFTWPGYTFTGWNTAPDGSGTPYADGAPYGFGADVTLYAQWTVNPTDTLTFDSEGGSGVDQVSGPDGSAVTLPDAPILAGYTFDGWFNDPSGDTALTSPYTLVGSVTLYAQWTSNVTDTLTFDSQGGSAVDPLSGYDGTTVTLPDAPDFPGYTFDGWFNDPSPSVDTALTSPYTLVGSVTLYAQWTPNPTDTLTFNSEGGSAVDQVSGLDGTTVTLPGAPVLPGYTFDGWFNDASGDTALTSPYTLVGSVTLYAQWTPNPTATLTFNSEGGSTVDQVSGLDGTTVTLPGAPVFGGRIFRGWFGNSSGGTALTSPYTLVGSVTLFAQWSSLGVTPQSITFASLANETLAQPSLTVSATASSGLTVTFSTTTPTVCTSGGTNGATITLLGSGICTVEANQYGNTTYQTAQPVIQGFTVSRVSQRITFLPPVSQTLAQPSLTVSATSTSALVVTFSTTTPGVCSASGPIGATIQLNGIGICTAVANQAGNGTYQAAPTVSESFSVSPVSQRITFLPPASQTLAQPSLTVSATSTSGLTVTFTTTTTAVCSSGGPNGATITLLAIGICTVAANQAGDGDFGAAPTVSESFSVSEATQTIAFQPPVSQPLTQGQLTVSATASSGLTVTFTTTTTGVCTAGGPNGATVTLLAYGICTVVASQAGDGDFGPAPSVSQSFTVTPATQRITFLPPVSQTLAVPSVTVSATSSSGLTVTFTTTTSTVCTSGGTNGATITLLAIGICTVAANQAGNGSIQAAPTVSESFSVSKATQKITFAPPVSQSLEESQLTVSATSTSALAVTFTTTTTAVCTAGGPNGATITLLETGTCTVVAQQAGDGDYQAAPSVSQSFKVKS